MLKKFLRYVLPSMVAFAFTGLYSIVDGTKGLPQSMSHILSSHS